MMQQREVMERSKEELMEELMAKLKEDLMKGRKQVAARDDIVLNVAKEEVEVKKGVTADWKVDNGHGNISAEEVVIKNLVEENEQFAFNEGVEMEDEHHFDKMVVKEEGTVENMLVEDIFKEGLVKEEKA